MVQPSGGDIALVARVERSALHIHELRQWNVNVSKQENRLEPSIRTVNTTLFKIAKFSSHHLLRSCCPLTFELGGSFRRRIGFHRTAL